MTKTLPIREFEKLKLYEESIQGHTLCQKDFDFLKNLNDFQENDPLQKFYKDYYPDKKPPKIIGFEGDKTLKIQNYVGMVRLPSGMVLEILPKVQIVPDGVDERQTLIDMIVRTLSPAISKETDAEKSDSLMDYIIWWFLHHMDVVVKQGIKQDYVTVQENSAFVKGKILFNQHIRHNAVLQHRTYIEYQDYTPDCVENRILHSALLACVRYAQNPTVKQKAVRHCHYFDGIGEMQSLHDFQNWTQSRYYQHYQDIKPLAEIILTGIQPFMTHGKKTIPAVLFPMEVVFEKYIAQCLQNHADMSINPQHTGHSLTDKNFTLRPDIVAKYKYKDKDNNNKTIIMDTKWKRYENGDISPSDAYQMFAYSQAYAHDGSGADTLLLYPKNHAPDQNQGNEITHNFKHGHKGTLKTHLIDLSQPPCEIAETILKPITEKNADGVAQLSATAG